MTQKLSHRVINQYWNYLLLFYGEILSYLFLYQNVNLLDILIILIYSIFLLSGIVFLNFKHTYCLTIPWWVLLCCILYVFFTPPSIQISSWNNRTWENEIVLQNYAKNTCEQLWRKKLLYKFCNLLTGKTALINNWTIYHEEGKYLRTRYCDFQLWLKMLIFFAE